MLGSKATPLRDIFALNRWVQIQCNKAGLRASFREGLPSPCTSDKEILIPEFNDAMTEKDVARLRGYVLHECLHHTEGPEVFEIGKQNRLSISHPLGALHNLFEDMRIERNGSKRYRGDGIILSDLRDIMGEDSVKYLDKFLRENGDNSLHDESSKIQAVFNEATLAQAEWCAGAATHARAVTELTYRLSEKVAEYISTLEGIKIRSLINNTASPYETFDLAKRVYGLLWDKTEDEIEQEIEKLRKEGEGEGEEQEECEDGEDGESEGGESKKKGKPKEGKSKKGKATDDVHPETGKKRIPFEWYVKSDHDGGDSTGHGLALDYTNHVVRNVYVPEPFSNMRIKTWNTGEHGRRGHLSSWGGSLQRMTPSSGFANQVRRYLQVRSQARYIGGQTKGKLHAHAVYRAGMPTVGSGEWNKRVFKHKHQSDILDTSVSLLVDMSGSMSGIKTVHATQAAMMLNHVISNALRVNTEILAFTYDCRTTIGVIKPFGQRLSDSDVHARFDDMTLQMWGNDDADSIAFGYDRLLQQKTKRKVMVVLSDGSPADGYSDSDPYYSLRKIVQEIEEARDIDIIGIGIMDHNVESFYKKHAVISHASDLEVELLKVINNTILATE